MTSWASSSSHHRCGCRHSVKRLRSSGGKPDPLADEVGLEPGVAGPGALSSPPTDEMPLGEMSDRRSTSRRNIDIHARMVAAVRAREVPEEILAADFRMEHHAAAAVDYAYSGATGWREWMSDLFEVFREGAQYRVEELVLAGDDFVVAMFRVVGRSVRSGNWLALCWVGVTWFHDGKATRAVGYTSRAAALKAVELHSRAKSEAAANAGSHARAKHL